MNRLEVIKELAAEYVRMELLQERAGRWTMNPRTEQSEGFKKMDDCKSRKEQTYRNLLLLGFTDYEIGVAVYAERERGRDD